ncbi:alpha/beta hydrolase [Actinomyces wuliandei]|uniref:alpha/beta hydrolase n=1 Tax=Actinomyces wuliandei TaxID=2057743 RepID=UPI000FDC1BA9|nr:alpha/beta hydrolase [Actinomyces wuliandei]
MSTSTTKRRVRQFLVVPCALLLACTGLTACQGGEPVAATPASAEASPEVPVGLESYYSQEADWYPCSEGMDRTQEDTGYTCATVSVPLDYDAPEGRTIDIAMKRRAADRESAGVLLVNPGGPGGSGVTFVERVTERFSQDVTDSYDVVGFDPRGVGQSTAVDCWTDAELDERRSGADGQEEDASPQQAAAAAQEDEATCQEATEVPGLLDHISTVSAARDLDVLRAVNGQDVLTYLGYSYGTYLGATYADLFPGNVGRMVLDGGLDPALSLDEVTQGQAEGFERALRVYVEDCQSGPSCPLTGDVGSGVEQVRQLLDSTAGSPIPTGDPSRPLTRPLARSAVLGALYSTDLWPVLTAGLSQAMGDNPDGSRLLAVADALAERDSQGAYRGNSAEAINAVNCQDYPVEGDEAAWEEQAQAVRQASPTFGEELVYGHAYCQGWDHFSSRENSEVAASGAAPILVVGTTGDPATPYEWSVSLADQLESGQLLTWEGEGHTAYGRAGDCVDDAVDAYLLRGDVPQEGLTCGG